MERNLCSAPCNVRFCWSQRGENRTKCLFHFNGILLVHKWCRSTPSINLSAFSNSFALHSLGSLCALRKLHIWDSKTQICVIVVSKRKKWKFFALFACFGGYLKQNFSRFTPYDDFMNASNGCYDAYSFSL